MSLHELYRDMVKDDTGPIYFDPDALCPGGSIVFRTFTYFPDNEYGNYVELITPENYIFKTEFRQPEQNTSTDKNNIQL